MVLKDFVCISFFCRVRMSSIQGCRWGNGRRGALRRFRNEFCSSGMNPAVKVRRMVGRRIELTVSGPWRRLSGNGGSHQSGETMQNYRRIWVCAFLFTLTAINYADRVALSVAVTPVAQEFGLSKVEVGYLLSSFLWAYVFCLIPVGLLVDRFGG